MERVEYLKLGSKIHDNVKKQIITDISNNIEQSILELRNKIHNLLLDELNKLTNITEKGLAFPIGISGDSIVAHYTPTKMSKIDKYHLPYYLNPDTTIKTFNILKIDYGVQLEGNIIDKAFSVNINNNELESILIDASKEAVEKMKKDIGVDSRLNELVQSAREIVESYEYNDESIKIVENVYSHNILPWKIHGDKFIKPDYLNYNEDFKVIPGEQYALEIYTSNGTGKGKLVESPITHSHYRLKETTPPLFYENELNELVNCTKLNIKSLPFCPNIINSYKFKINKKIPSHQKIISICQLLQNKNVIESYPPIIECDYTSCVAQIEEDILITNSESKIHL
jgi:methionyl aminopeptidase